MPEGTEQTLNNSAPGDGEGTHAPPGVRPARARDESATTLRAVAETVRRVMRADTTAVASFSPAEQTITWKALSGFRARGRDERELILPLRGRVAEQVAAAECPMMIVGIGRSGGPPDEEFPPHGGEGVHDLAIAPLSARGERLGVLTVGWRAQHPLSREEQQTLEGLADMAALALDNALLLETVGTSKKLWEQTFDAIPDGIIVHDARMRITRSNLSAAEMMGFDDPAEAVGLSCAAAFARLFGERAAAYHMDHRADAASSFEIQAEGGRRYLVTTAPLTSLESGVTSRESEVSEAGDPDSRPADSRLPTRDSRLNSWSVVTWSDVTRLSEMQEQLARARRLATVGQLAAGVAHEINNPLAAITTCAEATLRDLRAAPDELRRRAEEHNWPFYLEEIVRQALRCKAITSGLLDLGRQRRARRQACDLNTLVGRSVLLASQREGARGVTLSTSLDSSIGVMATDELMVRQVLDNLIGNALDALGGAGSVKVSTAAEGDRVRLEVADTGPGIAPEVLARVFDPFFTTKEAGKGSGLGLAISAALAEALGGSLTVESKPGAGSRFRLWLPRRAPGAGEEG